MIIVTQRSHTGFIETLETYTEREFATAYRGTFVRGELHDNFSNSDIERKKQTFYSVTGDFCYPDVVYALVAYNEKGKLLTVDHLIGVCRHEYVRKPYLWGWDRKRSCGKKLQTYGNYRNVNTRQELKWAHAWDDEEFNAPARVCRERDLSTGWWHDDVRFIRHTEKNWKKQSKRAGQWKQKT